MRYLLSISVAALLLLIMGCGEQTTSPSPTDTKSPGTGDTPSEIVGLLESNTPESFEMTSTGEPNWVAWPPYDLIKNSDVYAVTFVWGQLSPSMLPGMPVTDWSGRLWVNGVAVVQPRRTIHFDPGQDSILTEDDPAMAAWVSQTSVDFDGISFLVFVRRDIVYIMAPTLHFETPPIKLEFGFGQVAKLDSFYVLPQGNALAVHARQIWPARCPGGFMEGKWIKADNTGSSGRIEGLWLNHCGEPQGYIVGTFWTNSDGTREYSGAVSGYYLTYMIAEFKGRWVYDDPRLCPLPWCGTSHGWFSGRFIYSNGTGLGGVMAGEFGDLLSPAVDPLALQFTGVWQSACPWPTENRGSAKITN